MKFYFVLSGASKHAAALLTPCDGHQFIYDPETNRHLLDGGPLSVERFNEAAAFFADHWPESQYRPLPWIVPEEKRAKLKPLAPAPASTSATAPTPALALA